MSRKDRAAGQSASRAPSFQHKDTITAQDDIAEALDHIARAISAIDHNLEVLVTKLDRDSAAVARVAASLEGKPR
jgi:hypothetical protein